MSKSYWMKEQGGNFSNKQKDTFDPKKRYVGIRLQQGVPLLDRDWNELEDIRRYEEWKLRKWYVGNGTPDDGFKISAIGPPAKNNFKIKAGRCIVDGFEAVNDNDIVYTDQEGVKKPSKSEPLRVDTVYLDVWIEERKSGKGEYDAPDNSDDVNVPTCVRHKLEWRVRIEEGSEEYNKEGYHHYYDIARIRRKAGRNTILDTDIEDLRRTGLAVHHLKEANESLTNNSIADALHRHSKLVGCDGSPDPVLSVDKDGNVGIGTANPTRKLEVAGTIYGESDSYIGVYGKSSSGNPGVFGEHSTTGDYGALGSVGPNAGVYGKSTDGYAGYFFGRGYFSGNVGIGTADTRDFKLNIGGTNGQNAIHVASDFGLRGDDKVNLIKFGNDGNYQVLHKANGLFGRNTLAMHVHTADAFGVYSSGWTPLFGVKGGTGDVWWKGRTTSSSDARFKTNIAPLTDVLDKLKKIRGVSFEWNELYDESPGGSGGRRQIGLIAQEVETVFPELVTIWGDKDYRGVDYGRVTAVLVEAIKELKASVDAFKGKIKALEESIMKKKNSCNP